MTQLLNEELGKASFIKDKTNKNSVIDALTSAR
jgi:peptide subunit release factor 1 (eRF1)